VETAAEMMQAVRMCVGKTTTVLIMAAAVADFYPAVTAKTKIEKDKEVHIALLPTEDIVSSFAGSAERPFIIGFAAETGRNISRAGGKMKAKKMDMIVFNDITEPGAGFDVDTNKVTLIDGKGTTDLDLMSKNAAADAILDRMLEIKA
jgi:phosphopantothenoylcysteine decarboxylase/phosphopantothenate--cysteine ligase